jgi:hypothetical protein
MSVTRPPLDYLAKCSQMSLESVELSRLNLASNLRKEFQEILDEWIESEVDARLARSILEWRRGQDTAPIAPALETVARPARFEQLAIAFLPESTALSAGVGAAVVRKRGKKRIPICENALPVHLGDDNVSAAGKESRSTEPLSPRSTSLARASAANRNAGEGLVEPPYGKLRVSRKVCAVPEYSKRRPQAWQPSPGQMILAPPVGLAPKRTTSTRLARCALRGQSAYAAQHLCVGRAG